MLRWKTRLTDRNSNMWYTFKVFAHTSLTNAMQWGYDPWLQVTSQSHKSGLIFPPKPDKHCTSLPLLPYISIHENLFYLNLQRGSSSQRLLQNYLNAETQDDEKLYEITLFSECAVIPFLQESYRLKYLSKMACSEANRWSFETQRGHKTIISTTLPTSHTISMHTFLSANRERESRGGEGEKRREKGEKISYKRMQQINMFLVFLFLFYLLQKLPITRGQKQDRPQTRK